MMTIRGMPIMNAQSRDNAVTTAMLVVGVAIAPRQECAAADDGDGDDDDDDDDGGGGDDDYDTNKSHHTHGTKYS